MLDKIREMKGFLLACQMTEYLLPEQVALLTVALDVLEATLLTAGGAEYADILMAVDARTKGSLVDGGGGL